MTPPSDTFDSSHPMCKYVYPQGLTSLSMHHDAWNPWCRACNFRCYIAELSPDTVPYAVVTNLLFGPLSTDTVPSAVVTDSYLSRLSALVLCPTLCSQSSYSAHC